MKQHVLSWWQGLSAQERADWQCSFVSIASIASLAPMLILALF